MESQDATKNIPLYIMNTPIEAYKRLQTIDRIKDLAYKNIFEKYIIQNLRGDQKRTEIDSTDQESLMLRTNGGYPLPGFIYTYIYPSKKEELIISYHLTVSLACVTYIKLHLLLLSYPYLNIPLIKLSKYTK